MTKLRLISRTRAGRLTDAETVRLGRLLTHSLGAVHVSFPDDTPTAVAIAHGYGEELPPGMTPAVAELLGEFDQVVAEGA